MVQNNNEKLEKEIKRLRTVVDLLVRRVVTLERQLRHVKNEQNTIKYGITQIQHRVRD